MRPRRSALALRQEAPRRPRPGTQLAAVQAGGNGADRGRGVGSETDRARCPQRPVHACNRHRAVQPAWLLVVVGVDVDEMDRFGIRGRGKAHDAALTHPDPLDRARSGRDEPHCRPNYWGAERDHVHRRVMPGNANDVRVKVVVHVPSLHITQVRCSSGRLFSVDRSRCLRCGAGNGHFALYRVLLSRNHFSAIGQPCHGVDNADRESLVERCPCVATLESRELGAVRGHEGSSGCERS